MKQDSLESINQSAVRFFSGTLLSKFSGMARDMVMAFYFGTSSSLAAFFVAFRFVYLARRLFGESLLHQGFIPHFEEKRQNDQKLAALFFRDLFWTLTVFLSGVGICSALGLYLVGGQTAHLASLMLPGIAFISLFGYCTGLLQSEKSFFLPSVSPLFSNIIWILGVMIFRHYLPNQAMIGLSITLTIAFFCQLAAIFPKVWSYTKKHLTIAEVFQPLLFSAEIRKLVVPLLLGIVGVAAVQINSAMDGIFARFAHQEGPAYLWYAIRIQQLPLALFGIAFSSALLPTLSRTFQRGEVDEYFQILSYARKKTFALATPCVFGILALGLSSVNLLFGRGDFSSQALIQTTWCLWFYGLGLVPMAFVQIYAPAFYAKKDYRTPMLGFASATCLNLIFNALLVFVFKKGPASIALSTSLASAYNLWYLTRKLTRPKEKFHSSWRVVYCCLAASLVTIAVGYLFVGDATLLLSQPMQTFSCDLMTQMKQFFILTAVFFASLYVFARVWKSKDLLEIYSFVSRVAQRKSTS